MPALTDDVVQAVESLFTSFRDVTNLSNANKVAAVASYFASWPSDKPIITDAQGYPFIEVGKEKKLHITCDVAVYSLFFTAESTVNLLPTAADQAALWSNLEVIDVFAVGQTPYQLAAELGKDVHPSAAKIFDLPEQPHGQTYVEVVVGRKTPFAVKTGGWSPLTGKMVSGSVHRLVNSATVVLDSVSTSKPTGQDISTATHHHHAARQQQSEARFPVPKNAQPSFFSPAPKAELQAHSAQLVERQTPMPIQGPFTPITLTPPSI
ncbi:hypothetical protein FRC00_005425 [Tulasnella sp. 408]|nr:hypothetical protein FRC00_005425 [Tulasnella sp. 408]